MMREDLPCEILKCTKKIVQLRQRDTDREKGRRVRTERRETGPVDLHGKELAGKSCRTLCDPLECSPPGSSVHGILLARTLEWAAIPFSRGSSR